ncbi:MAG: hypothetical protein R6U44_02755 [Archaeoglobaceae archaeon]
MKFSFDRYPSFLAPVVSLDNKIQNFNIDPKYILILILLITAILAYYPHHGYDYPLHRDEWINLARSKAIISAEDSTYTNPHTGNVKNRDLEIGLNLWISNLLLASNMSEYALMKYLPIFMSCFIVFSAFLFARRLGYGLEAAFFTALIPTTIRLLGPAFVVAVSLAVAFMVLAAYIAFKQNKKKVDYAVLFIFLIFTFLTHPPTAIAAYILLSFYIVLYRDVKVLAVLLIPVVMFLFYFLQILSAVDDPLGLLERLSFDTFVEFGSPAREFGYIPAILAILGVIRSQRREVPVVAALLLLLVLNNIYSVVGTIPLLMPERNYFYIMVLTSIVAGYGLYTIRSKTILAALVIAVIALGFSAQSHVNEEYYYIVNDQEFQDFMYIKENVSGDKVLVRPWEGFALPAITEKPVYVYPGPSESAQEKSAKAYTFFDYGCTDTSFLVENDIDIVYAHDGCLNSDLREVKERIYVLNDTAIEKR